RNISDQGAPILVNQPPYLGDGTVTYSRWLLDASQQLEGQVRREAIIAPGDSLSDLVPFSRPPQGTSVLHLLIPGTIVGKGGLIRVALQYNYADPPLPPELLGDQPAPEAPPEGGQGEEGGQE
ncbi:MAG: hypothetical protein KC561_05645, partial [Myxococcales bacterium]|nr:hypothetical protein [Myxococcales bacterium]